MIDIFKHLLPTGRAWRLTVNKKLRQFFEGLTGLITDTRAFIDDVFDDINPQTTTKLGEWESQFGLLPAGLTDQGRRDRLDGAWKLAGGQDPQYIQDTMQAAGFDVYVYEWWEPIVGRPGGGSVDSDVSPTVRDPLLYLWDGITPRDNILSSGHNLAYCGGDKAYCASSQGQPPGYVLVNKILQASVSGILVGCGHTDLYCNGNNAYAASGGSLVEYDYKPYEIPSDVTKHPYFIYVGGVKFPDAPNVPTGRIDEFEDLLLKICPTEQWIGILGGGAVSQIQPLLLVAKPLNFIAVSSMEVTGGDFEVDWGNGVFINYTNPGVLSVSVIPTGDIKLRNIGTVSQVKFTSDSYTDIDIQDASSITSFDQMCTGLSQLLVFNAVNTQNVINCNEAWKDCTGLVAFPLIDTGNVQFFWLSWSNCNALLNFPLLDTSTGWDFTGAWDRCSSLTTFPALDFSLAQRFTQSWSGCTSLTSFPAVDASNVTAFEFAWFLCSSLTSVGLIDTSSGVRFNGTWSGCTSLVCLSSVNTLAAPAPSLISGAFDNTPLLVAPNATEQTALLSGSNYTNPGNCP